MTRCDTCAHETSAERDAKTTAGVLLCFAGTDSSARHLVAARNIGCLEGITLLTALAFTQIATVHRLTTINPWGENRFGAARPAAFVTGYRVNE